MQTPGCLQAWELGHEGNAFCTEGCGHRAFEPREDNGRASRSAKHPRYPRAQVFILLYTCVIYSTCNSTHSVPYITALMTAGTVCGVYALPSEQNVTVTSTVKTGEQTERVCCHRCSFTAVCPSLRWCQTQKKSQLRARDLSYTPSQTSSAASFSLNITF